MDRRPTAAGSRHPGSSLACPGAAALVCLPGAALLGKSDAKRVCAVIPFARQGHCPAHSTHQESGPRARQGNWCSGGQGSRSYMRGARPQPNLRSPCPE